MPGHKVSRGATSKDPTLFDKYQCPSCNHLLKNAVQPICGHWLCECCAVQLLAESLPKCPKVDCQEFLKSDEDGAEYFPDPFVRREVERMIVGCPHQQKGCQWEGRLAKLEDHLKECDFLSEECNLCGVVLSPDQIGSHGRVCPKALMKCPLAEFGCSYTRIMTREELNQHVNDHGLDRLQSLADALKLLLPNYQSGDTQSLMHLSSLDDATCQNVSLSRCSDAVKICFDDKDEVIESTGIHAASQQATSPHPTKAEIHYAIAIGRPFNSNYLAEKKAWKNELLEKDKKINSLSSLIAKVKEKCALFSKVESYIHGNTFEWKISLLSHKIKYARSGYLFPSYPFYSGPMGYKMCLQLYILGDGSGRGTHMSLFFVIMKGDFDDLLKWPFTSKVTIKLINQRGGRDISGTFQPDPKSSSFQKPTLDMNISSGCPRFVSHTELNEGGFVVDDVVFLQCLVDRSSIK